MEPVGIISLITAVIPFVTLGAKKLFRTDKLEGDTRAGVNALIPIIIGILSAGLYQYQQDPNIIKALAVGLASGGVASSARDIEKNLIGIVGSILKIFQKKKA